MNIDKLNIIEATLKQKYKAKLSIYITNNVKYNQHNMID